MRDEGRFWSLETNSHVLLLIETILIKIKDRMKLLVLSRFTNQYFKDYEKVNLTELIRTSRKVLRNESFTSFCLFKNSVLLFV